MDTDQMKVTPHIHFELIDQPEDNAIDIQCSCSGTNKQIGMLLQFIIASTKNNIPSNLLIESICKGLFMDISKSQISNSTTNILVHDKLIKKLEDLSKGVYNEGNLGLG